MRLFSIRCLRLWLLAAAVLSLSLLLSFQHAAARAVISEVMWMGSDLSAFDEWVEIAGIGKGQGLGQGSGSGMTSLSGWRLTVVNSAGVETEIIRFGTGTVIGSGETLLIGRLSGTGTRLLDVPFAVTPKVSLPNSKLLLRLRDAQGQVMDQVDDGVGVPFAGSNTDIKASMERINLSGSGAMASHWRTATGSVGFVVGAPVRGTPGFLWRSNLDEEEYEEAVASSTSGEIATGSGSMFSSSDIGIQPFMETKSESSEQQSSSLSTSPVTASGSSSSNKYCDQNFQVSGTGVVVSYCSTTQTQVTGSGASGSQSGSVINLSGATIGASSASAASFSSISSASGATTASFSSSSFSSAVAVTQSSPVPPAAPTTSVPSTTSCLVSPYHHLQISEFLPRPGADDTRGEWIEMRNTGEATMDLCGWFLDDSAGGSRPFSLSGYRLARDEYLVFYKVDSGLALTDTRDVVRLLAPDPTLADIPVSIAAGSTMRTIVVQEVSYVAAPRGQSYAMDAAGY
ncbi:MAG: hypothetical protein Greene041619_1256, partial [Candidatus Peregrinibacteria bacterium Greene0416_19]